MADSRLPQVCGNFCILKYAGILIPAHYPLRTFFSALSATFSHEIDLIKIQKGNFILLNNNCIDSK